MAPSAPNSYKVFVIADDSGEWNTNGIALGTEEEAQAYGADLYSRWTLVREWEVRSSDEPRSAIYSMAPGGEVMAKENPHSCDDPAAWLGAVRRS